MMKKTVVIVHFFILFTSSIVIAQNSLEFKGQLSALGSFSPDNEKDYFLGARYIPEIDYKIAIDSVKTFDFMVSGNAYANILFHPFDQSTTDASLDPYRIWARYTTKKLELRLGLQKIDFGTAVILRPLQWFNEIDPRDPLQLTNGVYGVLGRYYFLNNANIWTWVLYGNDSTRGFDILETNDTRPEFGGRIQYPVPKGEIAFSYHNRTTTSGNLVGLAADDSIDEHKFGLDGKWDITVGAWFELSQSHKTKNIGIFTNQTLFTVGTDYTFGIGSGLNVVAEHLISNLGEKAFKFDSTSNISALNISYPINFFNNVSSIISYNWDIENVTFNLNYEHQFKRIIGYVMLNYIPELQQGIQNNELLNNFSGPGIQFMLVYNH